MTFLYHVDSHRVETAGMEALERRLYAGHRWWTLDELADAADVIYPFGLAPLLDQLLTVGILQQPVKLPGYH